MARVATRKIGLGAVLVVVFLSVSTLAAADRTSGAHGALPNRRDGGEDKRGGC